MSRSRALGLTAVAIVIALLAPAGAWALFTAQTSNPQTVGADHVRNYVKLYSAGTDPWRFSASSYAERARCPSTPRAATGTNETLRVNLGGRRNSTTTVERVLTAEVAPTLPAGVNSVNVAIATLPDAQGRNVITGASWATHDGYEVGSSVANIPADTAGQLNLDINTRALPTNVDTDVTVRITVTFAGETSGFLRYDVPVGVANSNNCPS